MSIWIRWTPEQEKMWDQWIAERPECIQQYVKKYDLRMDRLYRLKSTGKKVTLYSLSEDETVTVNVFYRFNKDTMVSPLDERSVFGINPADLEECDWDGVVEDGQACLDDVDDDGEEEPELPAETVASFMEAWGKLIASEEARVSTKH